jgi:hypothetical protein
MWIRHIASPPQQIYVMLVVLRVLMVDLDELLAPVASKWSKRNTPRLYKQFPDPRFRQFDTNPLARQCGEDNTVDFVARQSEDHTG